VFYFNKATDPVYCIKDHVVHSPNLKIIYAGHILFKLMILGPAVCNCIKFNIREFIVGPLKSGKNKGHFA
jgi:hypothetical protein